MNPDSRTGALLKALFRIATTSVQYLYLSRVPFLGWLFMAAFPVLSWGPIRTLAIGAFDLAPQPGTPEKEGWQSWGAAFFVGFVLVVTARSIFLSARTIWSLGKARFGLDLSAYARGLERVWLWGVVLAVVLNVVGVLRVSGADYAGQLAVAMVVGILVALGFGAVWNKVTRKAHEHPFFQWAAVQARKIGFQPGLGYLHVHRDGRVDFEDGHIRAACYTGFVLLIYCGFGWSHFVLPPLVVLVMLLCLVVLALTGIAFFVDRFRLPLLLTIVGYLSFTTLWKESDHYYRIWRDEPPAPEITPMNVVAKSLEDQRPLVVISIAGGGIQSAAWSTQVLDEIGRRLAADKVDFARSVRLISGVSGGSVGAVFYAHAYDREGDGRFTKSAAGARASSLGPAVNALLQKDLWRAIAPFAIGNLYVDRGFALDQQWCENARQQFGDDYPSLEKVTLSGWGQDALALKRPALVLNSTIVESGERIAFSTVPKRLPLVGEVEFSRRRQPEGDEPRPAQDFEIGRYRANLAISTAARLSATFPFVSPTARPAVADGPFGEGRTVPGPEYWNVFPEGGSLNHMVDGGYFENSGLVGAIEWLDEALSDLADPKINAKKRPMPSRVLLIEINAFGRPTDPEDPLANERPSEKAVDAGEVSRGTVFDLTSPLLTVMNVRGSGQRAFARRLLRMFQTRWAKDHSENGGPPPVDIWHVPIFFEVENPRHDEGFFIGADPGTEPLSWHLRPSEQAEIQKTWKGFEPGNGSYKKILDFYQSQAPTR